MCGTVQSGRLRWIVDSGVPNKAAAVCGRWKAGESKVVSWQLEVLLPSAEALTGCKSRQDVKNERVWIEIRGEEVEERKDQGKGR